MTVYAIGDVQGSYDELRRLLDRVNFDPATDKAWFAGDLVNRGPQSRETLLFVRSLGDRAVTVLGNHDLHLLAVAQGYRQYHRRDSFQDILHADDRDELIDWLRYRPLLHHDPTSGFTLIHAGLPPQWDLAQARACAAEVEHALRADDYGDHIGHMYGNEPDRWSDDLTGWDRLRVIINCFTRLRYCDAEGRMALEEKGAPGTQPAPFTPWFAVPGRKTRNERVLFGHWSTLGIYKGDNVWGLDSGCAWGGSLTALRLDTGELTSEPCRGDAEPGSE